VKGEYKPCMKMDTATPTEALKIKPLLLRAMFFTALQQWPSKQDPQNYSSRE